jgi:ribonuclease T2
MMRRDLAGALPVALALALLAGVTGVSGGERNTPGTFDYYVLVLTWTPSYCRDEGKRRKDRQCDSTKPHTFLLHGCGRSTKSAGRSIARQASAPGCPKA